MNRTNIEWVINQDGTQGFSWNAEKGACPQRCGYCYMDGINARFKRNPSIRLDIEELNKPSRKKKPVTIFAGSSIDLFHNDIPSSHTEKIIEVVRNCPQHTFIFLTKNPSGYLNYKFPPNCWLGATEDGNQCNLDDFAKIRYPNKFISFEPLLKRIDPAWIPQVKLFIIGACTGKHRKAFPTDKEWVRELIDHARKKKIMVFVKDNLRWPEKLQELPWVNREARELF